MEEHALQFHPTVKEEPDESVIGVTSMNDSEIHLNIEDPPALCSELCTRGLFTDVKIEEMNMNNIKVEEHNDEKVFITNEQKKDQQVKQLPLRMQRVEKKIMSSRKLWKIARDYAALYSDEVRHPSPFPRFRGSLIIQCPACMIPRNDHSRSEFLHLLRHVEKRHPESSNFLFAEVSKMYWPLIESMERKIFNRIREKYSIRLRHQVATSNLSSG